MGRTLCRIDIPWLHVLQKHLEGPSAGVHSHPKREWPVQGDLWSFRVEAWIQTQRQQNRAQRLTLHQGFALTSSLSRRMVNKGYQERIDRDSDASVRSVLGQLSFTRKRKNMFPSEIKTPSASHHFTSLTHNKRQARFLYALVTN